MCQLHRAAGELDIFPKRLERCIDHHPGESKLEGAFDLVKRFRVIEHQSGGNTGPLDFCFDQAHQRGPRVLRCVVRINHDDRRRPVGSGRVHDRLRDLQIAGVICTDRPILSYTRLQDFCHRQEFHSASL